MKNVDEDVRIYAAASGDLLTRDGQLALGDLNDDGKDDLIIGTSNFDGPSGTRLSAGAAYVIYGSTTLPLIIDLATDADVVIFGAAGDGLTGGSSIAIGDLNDDTINDLVLGAGGADDGPDPSRRGVGAAFVIFGSSSLPASIDLDNSEEDVLIYGASQSDGLASAGLSTLGDVNGDGIVDLALGAPQAHGPGESRFRAGEAYIVFGSNALPPVIDIAVGADVTIYGATTEDRLTSSNSLVLGDANGDGFDDLLIGAASADGPSETRPGGGEVYLLYGTDAFPPIIDLASMEEDHTIFGASSGDKLLASDSLALADLDGDGIDDIVLGAASADGPADSRADAGEVYLFLSGTPPLPIGESMLRLVLILTLASLGLLGMRSARRRL